MVGGTIVRREDQSLLLRVPLRLRRESVYDAALGQDVRIPTTEILQLERRQIDGGRTIVLLAGGVAAVTFLVLGIMEASGREGLPPILIEDQDRVARVPLFSFFPR